MKKYILGCIITVMHSMVEAKAPRLMVFIVIDQFSAHYIPKLSPFLTGGLKFLSEEGISYVNAFYDQSMPATAPGHALLSTGTYASFHGVINNLWYDVEGKKVRCDSDDRPQSAVFAPDGSLYCNGKSSKNLLADTFADQCMMHSYPHARNEVWALSLKSRASIMLAGKLGKPLWLDSKTGAFTSSKAYFEKLPSWVIEFNKERNLAKKTEVTWKPFFDSSSPAYAFKEIDNYRYSSLEESLVGKTLPIEPNDYKSIFSKTPESNQLLLDLGLSCINTHYTGKETDRLIVYLSLSTLDKTSHTFGPQSKDVIDLLYHVDHQLKEFMTQVYAKVPKEEVLFVLTADHGAPPIPEILNNQGFSLARRLNYPTIVEHINLLIENKCGIKGIVQHFKEPQLYLNQWILSSLTEAMQQTIYELIKNYIQSLPGIRRTWTFEELRKQTFEAYDLDKYMQRQLYKGRSGQIFYAISPYVMLDAYTTGTSHSSEFAYDTQVPLIFYQKGTFMKKRVTKNVYIPQVVVSLATMYNVPRPSAAAAEVLPELPV